MTIIRNQIKLPTPYIPRSSSISSPAYREADIVPYGSSLHTKEDRNWSSLSNRLGRDLPLATHDRMIALSFMLYRTNPMAKRLVNMRVEFILGKGIHVSSDDPDTLKVIQSFWDDKYNNWPLRIARRLRDLFIYGEWLIAPLVNPGDGRVWVNYWQPSIIKQPHPSLINHEIVDSITLKRLQLPDGRIVEDKTFKTIRKLYDHQYESNPYDTYDGDLFYFGINQTTDSMRGVGDLFTLIDFLDLYDQVLFDRAEKVAAMSAVWWDLKMEGKNEDEIREYLKDETNIPPRRGSVYAHNERAELKAHTADLKADDHVEDTRVLKSHIISSDGWPGTYYDDPGTAGRAVGAEMAEPTHKAITATQSYVGTLLREIIDFVLAHAARVGKLPNGPAPYALAFPRPSTRDIQRTGPALFRMSQALEVMIRNNILTVEQAQRVAISQLNELGLSDAPLSLELRVK